MKRVSVLLLARVALRRVPVAALALAGIVVAIYLPAARFGFVAYDDPEYVTGNPVVQSGVTWAGVKWALTTSHASNWHPLTWLSHMLDVEMFGRAAAGPHVINALLHAANAVLLLLVMCRLTGAPGRSVAVAALFALHPLRVESVAWVSERKDVLGTLFFLLALWAYVRAVRGGTGEGDEGREKKDAAGSACHSERSEASTGDTRNARGFFTAFRTTIRGERRRRSEESTVSPVDERATGGVLPSPLHTCRRPFAPGAVRWYLAALLFFALGLMSKPTVVTLPFVLLLLDWWPLGRFGGRTAAGVPAAAAARLAGVRRFWMLTLEKLPFFFLSAAASAATVVAQRRGGAVRSLESFPFDTRLENAVVSYGRYLGKIFWPADLAVFYPHPGAWAPAAVAAAGALLAAVSILVVRSARRHPYGAVGWLWFCGMAVPVIGLVQVGGAAIADRYTYLPSVGVLVAVTWTAHAALASHPRWLGGLLALVLGGCAWLTCGQLRYWRDSETLFRHALAVTDENYVAHGNLAGVLLDRGDLDAAIRHAEAAVAIRPDYADAHINLGQALLRQGRVDDAIMFLAKATTLVPADADAHLDLANALLSAGRLTDGIAHYRTAASLRPGDAKVRNGLGWALFMAGSPDEALTQLGIAVELAPDYANAHHNLAGVLVARGEIRAAISHLREAAMSHRRQGDPAAAAAAAGRALGLARVHTGLNLDDQLRRQLEELAELPPPGADIRTP